MNLLTECTIVLKYSEKSMHKHKLVTPSKNGVLSVGELNHRRMFGNGVNFKAAGDVTRHYDPY